MVFSSITGFMIVYFYIACYAEQCAEVLMTRGGNAGDNLNAAHRIRGKKSTSGLGKG